MAYCKRSIVRSTAVTLSGNTLTITLPDVNTIINGDIIRFVILQTIPTTTPFATVYVKINNETIPVLTRFGNSVMADQLRTRRVYAIGIGTQYPNSVMLTCIPKSGYSFPTIVTPTVTTNNESISTQIKKQIKSE